MAIDNAGPLLRPIAEVNQLSPTELGCALRPLFEAAGPLALALYAKRPFASYADLLDRAESLVDELSARAKIEVLSAHPRIGERAATVKELSALSYHEQGYAGEAALPQEDVQLVYAALEKLNRAYEERFGFRFVVFVDGRPKSAIVDILRTRLANSPEEELRAGLEAMFAIARDRLARSGEQ
jgi:OHCU decarboxylase